MAVNILAPIAGEPKINETDLYGKTNGLIKRLSNQPQFAYKEVSENFIRVHCELSRNVAREQFKLLWNQMMQLRSINQFKDICNWYGNTQAKKVLNQTNVQSYNYNSNINTISIGCGRIDNNKNISKSAPSTQDSVIRKDLLNDYCVPPIDGMKSAIQDHSAYNYSTSNNHNSKTDVSEPINSTDKNTNNNNVNSNDTVCGKRKRLCDSKTDIPEAKKAKINVKSTTISVNTKLNDSFASPPRCSRCGLPSPFSREFCFLCGYPMHGMPTSDSGTYQNQNSSNTSLFMQNNNNNNSAKSSPLAGFDVDDVSMVAIGENNCNDNEKTCNVHCNDGSNNSSVISSASNNKNPNAENNSNTKSTNNSSDNNKYGSSSNTDDISINCCTSEQSSNDIDNNEKSYEKIDNGMIFYVATSKAAPGTSFKVKNDTCTTCKRKFKAVRNNKGANAQSHHDSYHQTKLLPSNSTTARTKNNTKITTFFKQQEKPHKPRNSMTISNSRMLNKNTNDACDCFGCKESDIDCMGYIPDELVTMGVNHDTFLQYVPVGIVNEITPFAWIHNHGFHSYSCRGKMFKNELSKNCNDICQQLSMQHKLNKALRKANNLDDKCTPHTRKSHFNLKHILNVPARKTKQKYLIKINRLELALFNERQKNLMHDRILRISLTQEIPMMDLVARQGKKHGWSLGTIFEKMIACADGRYKPSQTGIKRYHIGMMILAVAGPKGLGFCHRAGLLMAPSTARKALRAFKQNVKYHPRGITEQSVTNRANLIAKKEFEVNLRQRQSNDNEDNGIDEYDLEESNFSLEKKENEECITILQEGSIYWRVSIIAYDEIHVDEKLGYIAGENLFAGVCDEHRQDNSPLYFYDLGSFEQLQHQIKNGERHLAGKVAVYLISVWDEKVSVTHQVRRYFVVAIPHCGKKASIKYHLKTFLSIRNGIKNSILQNNTFCLSNHCDGDGVQRKLFKILYTLDFEIVDHNLSFLPKKTIHCGGDTRHQIKNEYKATNKSFVKKDSSFRLCFLGASINIREIKSILSKIKFMKNDPFAAFQIENVFDYSKDPQNVPHALIFYKSIEEMTKSKHINEIMSMFNSEAKQQEITKLLRALKVYARCWNGYCRSQLDVGLNGSQRVELMADSLLINFTMYSRYGRKWSTRQTYFDVTQNIVTQIQEGILVSTNENVKNVPILPTEMGSQPVEERFIEMRFCPGGKHLDVPMVFDRIGSSQATFISIVRIQ